MLRLALIICLATCLPRPGLATEPAAPELRRQVLELVEQLDSDRFDIRRKAAASLDELAAQPDAQRLLAVELRRVLVSAEVSFEVRRRLEQTLLRLPEVDIEPARTVTPEEIERLVRQLEDDSYGVRLGATKRLEWLLRTPALSVSIMVGLKARLAQGERTAEIRQRLIPLYDRARGLWLSSDPADWPPLNISDEEIDRWVDQLAALPSDRTRSAAWEAERELSDLLARDKLVPRVKRALEAKLSESRLDPRAAARLKKLLDLTRPAMVAEYWQGRQNLGEQHLLVGVPSLGPGAQRPSHFDRIDDNSAHCVSGNSLSPGDYPVGVAFPHPQQPTRAFFHLVNLPTPRRRMAYTHSVKEDDAKRLAAISRRTFERILAERRALSDHELSLLAQFDPNEISRFAGKYFLQVDDSLKSNSPRGGAIGQPSRHGTICIMLMTTGTKLAIPGLLEAIKKDRFLPATKTSPYQWQWIAALAIAVRDPWPDVDVWLAGLIDRADPLAVERDASAELGATAAALLLKRREQSAFQFGLEPVVDPWLGRLGIDGWRFSSPEARRKVLQWWRQEAARAHQAGHPSRGVLAASL